MKTIRELNDELRRLEFVEFDSRVNAARALVRAERKPRIDEIKAELEKLRSKRSDKKPRWDENTPKHILDVCSKYWNGTTEFYSYRIHLWNDDFVWTSYPSGGYSNNGGWHPTPACFHLISLKSMERGKPTHVKSLDGRVTKNMMLEGFKYAKNSPNQ